MSTENLVVPDPVFDPARPGKSMDELNALIPQRAAALDGLQLGDTLSRRLGQGIEVDGLREYQIGDEPRHIDWRATARNPEGELVVREHYRDITPSLWLVTDSLGYRHRSNPGYFSEESLAISALLTLGQIGSRQGMPVGVVLGGDERIWKTEPSQGRPHHRNIRAQIAKTMLAETSLESNEESNLTSALQKVARLATDSVVVVISDFRDVFDPRTKQNSWKRAMQMLRRNGNEVMALEITNPWDFRLPEESDRFTLGSRGIYIGGKVRQKLRETYSELAEQQQVIITNELRATQAAKMQLSTAEPKWFRSLRQQLTKFARQNNRAA